MQLHITCGDPLGIGPEIVVRSLTSSSFPSGTALPRVYGHRQVLQNRCIELGVDLPPMDLIEPQKTLDPLKSPGHAQVAYLEDAMSSILKQPQKAVLITAPISKESARRGGLEFPGHTEYLAHHSQSPKVAMMMAGPRLNVILATTHIPLKEVPTRLENCDLTGTIVMACESLRRDFGFPRPHLAVSGLNPHAGENGAFGNEESRLIQPAMEESRKRLADKGIPSQLSGPHPPDTVFWQAIQGRFHGVLALYHDQGLIASKLLDLHDTVNVTLGLPFVRTSPDHGVAYDIVGTGKAKPDSFTAAVRLGMEIWNRRHQG